MNGPSLIPTLGWAAFSAGSLWFETPPVVVWIFGVNLGLALEQYARKVRYAATPRP